MNKFTSKNHVWAMLLASSALLLPHTASAQNIRPKSPISR